MKQIYLTIDIECHDISKYDYYIEGKIGNDYYGLRRILEICKENDITLNCFVDFAECHRYGDEYIKKIIDIINEYNQPIYLHLHPNFITGDDNRSFLWEYSYEEQKEILKTGFNDYKRFVGKECTVFRVGRYGCDTNMYKALADYGELTDLSYCYKFESMCHYNAGVYNKPIKHENITIMPNTRYCSFKLFKRIKYVNFDIPGTNIFEYKKIITNKNLQSFVCTMHSWSLLKKGLFSKDSFSVNRNAIKKLYKLVSIAKKNDVVFSRIDNGISLDTNDDKLDLCDSPLSYCLEMIGTFFRIRKLTRTNKKYFYIYLIFYFLLIVLGVLFVLLIA